MGYVVKNEGEALKENEYWSDKFDCRTVGCENEREESPSGPWCESCRLKEAEKVRASYQAWCLSRGLPFVANSWLPCYNKEVKEEGALL